MRKRKTWLHWIGNLHYSVANFIKESKKLGVSRRVPQQILRNMEWGDRIYLASRVPERGKSPVCFGYFEITRIAGIQLDEMPDELRNKVENVKDPSTDFQFAIERGCGWVEIGAYYLTTLGVEELADYTDDPMIEGGLKIFQKPWPMFYRMPPFRGFRGFDADAFHADLNEGQKKLKRFYYK